MLATGENSTPAVAMPSLSLVHESLLINAHVLSTVMDFNSMIWQLWNTGYGHTNLVSSMFQYLFYDAEQSYAALSPKILAVKKCFSLRRTAFNLIDRFAEGDLIPFSKKDKAQDDDAGWKQTTSNLLVDALARIHSISIEKKLLVQRKKSLCPSSLGGRKSGRH